MTRARRPIPGSLAVVTGASAGIGRGFALELSRRGHPVLAVARRGDRLQTLADEAQAAGGAVVHPLVLDVTGEGAASQIAQAAHQLGAVGWLVNNAGAARFEWFGEGGVDGERAQIRLNVEAVATVTAAFLPTLIRQRSGIVLNVASSAGFQPTPGWATYGATKAFVVSLTEALSEELRGTGVSATALCPGPVTTEIFAASATPSARRRPRHEISVEQCVDAGVTGALRGRVIVVPGLFSRVLALSAKLSPRAVVRRVSALTSLRLIGLPPLSARPPRQIASPTTRPG